MNKTQRYGVLSLGIMGVAAIFAALAMFATSWLLGVVYLAICAFTPQAIVYGFCAKCPNKEQCGHVFPGKAAMRMLRPAGAYTPFELGGLGVAAILLFGFPQVWLWRYPALFWAFWGLLIVAGVMIRLAMCPVCGNVYCPGNPQFKKGSVQ